MQQTKLPDKVDRKVTNRNEDCWFEYDGEPMFSDSALDRIKQRFEQMRNHQWEKIAYVKGSNRTETKIRTKDLRQFKNELETQHNGWVEQYGQPLTRFGNAAYGEVLTQAVTIKDESARKTVVVSNYNAGYSVGMGGEKNKKQSILLPIREFEQWFYHNEVVKPLFEKYNDKYPY